jgi:hypothetical protein
MVNKKFLVRQIIPNLSGACYAIWLIVLIITINTLKSMHTFILLRKCKAVPLQAWSGPEASRKLRFPDYMTTAQDGGKVVRLTHRPPLAPGNAPRHNAIGRIVNEKFQ